MACFCIVFSGAIKKVLQLHAYQKIGMIIHTDYEGRTHSPQNLRDGYREKHEVQILELTDKKQVPVPGSNPSPDLLLSQSLSVAYSLYSYNCFPQDDNKNTTTVSNSIPVYLLFHRLQV